MEREIVKALKEIVQELHGIRRELRESRQNVEFKIKEGVRAEELASKIQDHVVKTINERRAENGLEPIPAGNIAMVIEE